MEINKLKNRNIIFTYNNPDGWDLNLQLVKGNKYNYIIDTGLGSLSILPVINYIKDDKKPTIVINTHSHWDHIWGNSLSDLGESYSGVIPIRCRVIYHLYFRVKSIHG